MVSKRILKAAQSVVKKSPASILVNQSNRQLCELVEVGTLINSVIVLSSDDIRKIERYFNDYLGTDILYADLNAHTRTEMAALPVNEKWASGTVFQSLITVASFEAIPLLDQNDVPAEVNYLVSLSLEQLDISRLTKVVVVENGELLVNWKQTINALPQEWQQVLLVYRGHGENQKDLQSLIAALDDQCELALFCDYDAAGFDIALKLSGEKQFSLVVPLIPNDDLKTYTKTYQFEVQYPTLVTLLSFRQNSDTVFEHLTYLKDKKLAVTQEHLIVNSFPLKVIKYHS